MSISILASNIEKLGFKTSIIGKKDWTYDDIIPLVEPKKIFIFSTDDVGHGDFGRFNTEEIKKDKWKHAYGIIKCDNYKDASKSEIDVVFSVVPKHSFDNLKIISSCLKTEQECSICNKISKHVKIDTELGLIYCLECYSKIPSYSTATICL